MISVGCWPRSSAQGLASAWHSDSVEQTLQKLKHLGPPCVLFEQKKMWVLPILTTTYGKIMRIYEYIGNGKCNDILAFEDGLSTYKIASSIGIQ